MWFSLLGREAHECLRMRHGHLGFAADGREHATKQMRESDRRNVPTLQSEAEPLLRHAARSINISQRPEHQREVETGWHAGIKGDTGGQMVIPLIIIGREGLLKMRPRTDIIALEPAGRAKDAACNRG